LARSADKLTTLADELGGDNARVYPCDVTSWSQQQVAVSRIIEDMGAIHAVFANAGRGMGPGGYTRGDPSEWADLVNVNILGLMYTIRATADALKASKGQLLITSSMAGRRIVKGSVYSATKWAATAIGNNVRGELGEYGVGVTLIEPGVVDTPFFDVPRPGNLKAEDVAELVLFTLSRPAHVQLPELAIVPA